jgi:uncharacterized protein (DUF433 family)
MKKQVLTRGHATKILEWCKKEYGPSKYKKRYPDLEFRKIRYADEEDQDGYYDDYLNLIFINRQSHNHVNELTKTVIEEYIHYTQSEKEYQRLAEIYSYSKHPLELQAKYRANKDYKRCVKELKKIHRTFQLL